MGSQFSRVRGTEDVLDTKLHNFVISLVAKHLEKYNFSEITTPILEPTSLFVRSLGEQTDVVSKEMYIFETGSGESICLRPEGTAGTMRAFLENSVQQKPWKVWSHGPMFRHERPQKGRWRQFTQINIEVIDAESITQDAHFLKMLDNFFKNKLLLENYVLKLNFLGNSKDREKHRAELKKYLDKVEDKICKTCLVRKEKNILRIFDCKNEDCQRIYRDAPKLTDYLCDDSAKEWDRLKELLEFLSVNFVHAPELVRGLDYYNKTVFEFTSQDLGAQNAFCAGGRYELGQELGAKKEVPSIGGAIGLGRVLMLLDTVKDKLVIPQEPRLHVVIPMSEEQKTLGLMLADTMLNAGLCVEVLLEGGSMKSLMRRANKLGASHVLIIGEDEQKNGTVSLKNMTSGESEVVKQVDVVPLLSV